MAYSTNPNLPKARASAKTFWHVHLVAIFVIVSGMLL